MPLPVVQFVKVPDSAAADATGPLPAAPGLGGYAAPGGKAESPDHSSGQRAVAVIIVAYHGARWIPWCLATLEQASRDRLRVIIVDNGGNDGCIPETAPQFDYSIVVSPRPMGFAEANNLALRRDLAAGFEAVCFLNQDTLSQPGWIDSCRECLSERAERGAMTPLLRSFDGHEWDPGFLDCARQSSQFDCDRPDARKLAKFYAVPRVTAAAMMVRASALRAVGPFDPIFGSYYEDYDLCRRLRCAGYEIGICGQATVRHYSGSCTTTAAAARRRMRQIVRNRTIDRIREAGDKRWPALLHYALWTLPRNVARSFLQTPSSQPLAVQLGANWDLLRDWRRLTSAACDRRAWVEYLKNIEWTAPCESNSNGTTA
ncbi:MAG: glycosyltransferase family 2 protein [Planctomycetaceae bacterium]